MANSQSIFKYEREINHKEKYNFKEINFENTNENIEISGTLITPKSSFDKIVIIVPGSGKDTRYSHFVLAEELLKHNVAVYRFDERGVGRSEGEYSELVESLSSDLGFAFQKIQHQYKNKQIGVIGHSLGGIATLEIIKNKIYPNFVILIETPIVKNGYFIIYQIKMDYENRIPEVMREGKTKNEVLTFLKGYMDIVSKNNTTSLKKEIRKYIKSSGFRKKFIVLLDDKFLTEMSRVNLENTLKTTSIKILYLTGSKDNVINQKKEIELVKSYNNPNIEVKMFDGLNHYLTEKNAKVGTSLYKMDESALKKIINWTLKQ